jgi:hypothetical protein
MFFVPCAHLLCGDAVTAPTIACVGAHQHRSFTVRARLQQPFLEPIVTKRTCTAPLAVVRIHFLVT